MLTITPLSTPPSVPSLEALGLCARLTSAGSGHNPHDRWSFYPTSPTRLLICDATGHATLSDANGIIERFNDPLAALNFLDSTLTHPARHDPSQPPFVAGWIGFLSYDLGRRFEHLPARADHDPALPLFAFIFCPESFALDHHTQRWFHTRYTGELDGPPMHRDPIHPHVRAPGPLHAVQSPQSFQSAVARAIDYIAAGDIFQVNLSHQLRTRLTDSPFEIFQRAQRLVPAWYGAYLSFGDLALVSNSPELFLELIPQPDGTRLIRTRPIKGTRPRAEGMDKTLRDSLKDQAELNMIIDLERNDLGRIARIGSVHVAEPRTIETHPTVYHGAATIQGIIPPDVTLVQTLAATFPGGSVTGAPKIRAMQIIDELEPVPRGPYCGAIGFLSLDGQITLNLAIRTLVIHHQLVTLNVGGGIVADSVPLEEYEETLTKARQLLTALGRTPTIFGK